MQMVCHALGLEVDELSTRLNLAVATRDIAWSGGIVKAGTVAEAMA